MNFLFIFLFVFSPVIAEDFSFNKETGQAVPTFVGEIKFFKGNVFKANQGRLTAVKEGTRFYKNDTIVTEEKSLAKILIVDDTTLNIGPKSELKFSEFNYIDKSNRSILYSFIKGQVRAIIKNKAKYGDLQIKTKSAVMGIRGTELFANHQTINNLEVSEFSLLSGNAEVKDNNNQTVSLSKNDKVVIIENQQSNQSISHKGIMTKEELETLRPEEVFMPYFEIQNIDKDSTFYSFLNTPNPTGLSTLNNSEMPKESQKRSWKENLKRLNEKLKENQKK
jgi:hypothetical protein